MNMSGYVPEGNNPFNNIESVNEAFGINTDNLMTPQDGLNSGNLFKLDAVYNKYEYKPSALSKVDMAQSHFFKIEISGITLDGHLPPSKQYGKFLPLKNIQYTETGLQSMDLPLGVFADFPIIVKKKIAKLNITLLDTDDDFYQHRVKAWYNSCIPNESGYVNFLDYMIRELTYTSYNVKGVVNSIERYMVIPIGDVTCSRSYEDNALKEVSFAMAIVGRIGGVEDTQ